MEPYAPRVPDAPFPVQQGTHNATQPVLVRPVRPRPGLALAGTAGLVLAGIALLVVFGYLVAVLGASGFLVAGIIALVPLTIVVLAVRWIDRWEPEPRTVLAFGFLWGAGVSVLFALLVDSEVQNLINAMGGTADQFQFVQAAVQAPIVEEVGKGLGLLLIFLFARRYFDGPVDGIVYAACVGAGFAFTENIQYFGIAILEGGGLGPIAGVFIVRGLMSPFAHVMFTAITGFAIGVAAHRFGVLGGVVAFLIGLVPAILLHAFWNGALFFVPDFFGYYVLVQVPLFLLAIAFLVYLRKQEQRLTFARLQEYAEAGWFNPAEIPVLATAAGRRQAQRWAASYGLSRQMRRYIHDATGLAFVRQRLIRGHNDVHTRDEERQALNAIVASRRALQGVPVRR